jgi:hypothetical protein
MNSTKIRKKLNELKSTFITMKEDEPKKIDIKKSELFENETRNNMVKWLSFLCDTLNFNSQTLYRTVTIFDEFISISDPLENDDLNQEKMNLITIGCLSLATKLEEINCNYVRFFTDKVINLPDCQIFSVKDLTKMELKILKKLGFKTLYSTAYDFLLYFLDIFQYFYNPSNYCFENVKNHTLFLMKQNINTNLYLSMNQSDYAFFCLYQAFLEIGNNDIMQKILNILILLNNDVDKNDLKRQNRTDDINNKFIFRNSQVNIFSLSSF